MVLILAAVANGLLFSGRETGKRLKPKWWLDLHQGLGGYALIFTGVHLITAYAADLGVGFSTVFLPDRAPVDAAAFTWGVLAFYGLAITVLSSWPKKRMRRTAWHLVHLLSIPAAVAAVVHAIQLGSDAQSPAFIALLLACAFGVTFPIGLRLTGMARRRRTSATPTRTGGPSATAPPVQAERELVVTGR